MKNPKQKTEITKQHTKLCGDLLFRFGSHVRIASLAKHSYNFVCRLMSPLVHLYPSSNRFTSFKTRRDRVIAFLKSEGVSTQLPGANHAGVFFLNNCLCSTHEKFRRETGSTISFPLFCRFRPNCVKLIHEIPSRMSVCQECENVRLKADALMAARVVGCPSSVIDGLRRIWCASESGDSLPWLKCAQMSCPNCNTGRLKLEKDLLNNAKSNPVAARSVVYYEWKDAFRVQRSQETTSLQQLLTMFLDSVVALSMHVFIATWQWIEFQDLKKHLRPGTLVTVRDFAQNYLNMFQDEPSGAH